MASPSKTTTRDEAAEQFWCDVLELLTQKHGRAPTEAEQGIDQYKREVLPRVGEVAFNQGEERTAGVIDGIIANGLPQHSIGD
jgi:hypothetical protein